MWGLDDLLYIGIGLLVILALAFFLLQELKPFYLQWCWHIPDVRLGLGQDGWGSLLTQMAGTKAKHRA